MSATSAPDQLWRAALSQSQSSPLELDNTEIDVAALSFDRLLDKVRAVAESAVDPLEIAARLESEGISDQCARERFGCTSIFALAIEVYTHTSRRPIEPAPPADPWASQRWVPILHALAYGLPALFFPAAASLLVGRGVAPVLVVTLLLSCSLTQGIGYLGYARLSAAGPEETRRQLRVTGLATLGMICLGVTVTALLVHADPAVPWFAVGEGAYMCGAAVLFTVGSGPLLLVPLAPGVLGSTVFLVLGRPHAMMPFAWSALSAAPLLALVLAGIRTRVAGHRAKPILSSAELRMAWPAAGFGLVSAGLLAFPFLIGTRGHGGPNPGALLASLPISISIGAAEWRLLWYRRRCQHLLRTTTDLRRYTAKARVALLTAAIEYTGVALLLIALAGAIATAFSLVRLHPVVVVELAAYLLLGTALFFALALQALSLRALTLAGCALALTAEIILRNLGALSPLLASGALLLLLGSYGLAELGRAVRHGY